MKSFIPYSLIAAALTCGFASAQTPTTAYTTPVGYTSIACLNASDTWVGTPLKSPTVAAAALTADPVAGPPIVGPPASTTSVLTVSGAAFGSYAGTSYVKFTSGPASGKVYAIYANDATTITIDLNGDTQTAVSGDTFSVTAFWTLQTLFPPTLSGSTAATTGTAIVTSASMLAGARKTQVLLAREGTGTNLGTSALYFINGAGAATGGVWRIPGDSVIDRGGVQLWPDTYFIIRNPSTVGASTSYVCTGEVDMGNVVIPLASRVGTTSTTQQDTPVALNRPVDLTLNQLNLGGTAAFVGSANGLAGNRKDTLLVYNNAAAQINKSASAVYFWNIAVNAWNVPGNTTDVGNTVIIPAGAGLVVRKFPTVSGTTSFWNNTPSY